MNYQINYVYSTVDLFSANDDQWWQTVGKHQKRNIQQMVTLINVPCMLGTGRSYLCFFLRGFGLTARGGRQGIWLALKNVTMKGCLERGPRRPTKPIQPADRERSAGTRFETHWGNLYFKPALCKLSHEQPLVAWVVTTVIAIALPPLNIYNFLQNRTRITGFIENNSLDGLTPRQCTI